jgi:cytochrome P450
MKEQIQPPKGAPLFNPWSPEFIANPYPSYHLLRETEPMHYMPLGLYVASRHAGITTILRDKRFGKDFTGRVARRASAIVPRGRQCDQPRRWPRRRPRRSVRLARTGGRRRRVSRVADRPDFGLRCLQGADTDSMKFIKPLK